MYLFLKSQKSKPRKYTSCKKKPLVVCSQSALCFDLLGPLPRSFKRLQIEVYPEDTVPRLAYQQINYAYADVKMMS